MTQQGAFTYYVIIGGGLGGQGISGGGWEESRGEEKRGRGGRGKEGGNSSSPHLIVFSVISVLWGVREGVRGRKRERAQKGNRGGEGEKWEEKR